MSEKHATGAQADMGIRLAEALEQRARDVTEIGALLGGEKRVTDQVEWQAAAWIRGQIGATGEQAKPAAGEDVAGENPEAALERICGESYQVVGTLAVEAGRFDDEAVIKALDNLSLQRLVHEDVLPFPARGSGEACRVDAMNERNSVMGFEAEFRGDIGSHVMEVLRDEGVYRHLRFRRPGTMCMHFDIVTWPGYLCYTGDMGTYVFRRLHDMLEFFRREADRAPYRIDMRYWAEKVQAADRCDGVDEFSPGAFRTLVRAYFDDATGEHDDWPEERRSKLWGQIEECVLDGVDEGGEHAAFAALREFEHDGFRFDDWEGRCRDFSHRFMWCCFALEWAVGVYDAAKQPEGVA